VAFSAGGDGGTRRQPSDPVRGISPPKLYGIDGERRKSPAQGKRVAFHATAATALASKGTRASEPCGVGDISRFSHARERGPYVVLTTLYA
jgi:hypothetical protein